MIVGAGTMVGYHIQDFCSDLKLLIGTTSEFGPLVSGSKQPVPLNQPVPSQI